MGLARGLCTITAALCLAACTGGITSGNGDDDDGGGGGTDGDGSVDDEGPYEGELGTIMFVTQVPVGGIGTLTAPFGNHLSTMESAPRGGDLMIRYPDGTLRNLTREAGFGDAGEMQGANAIAVREPSVSFSGNTALFAMLVGAVTEQYDQRQNFHWQIYEVTGLARGETAGIRRIEGQPENYNNLSPIYGSDGRILFISDRPRTGEAHLYPQLDEYESQPTVVGIYSLDEEAGDLELIQHAPSGVFSPVARQRGAGGLHQVGPPAARPAGRRRGPGLALGRPTYADESAGAPRRTPWPAARSSPRRATRARGPCRRRLRRTATTSSSPGRSTRTAAPRRRSTTSAGRSGAAPTTTAASPTTTTSPSRPEDVYRAGSLQLRGDGGVFHIRQDPVEPAGTSRPRRPEFGTGTGAASSGCRATRRQPGGHAGRRR